jgi:hypothetical protein
VRIATHIPLSLSNCQPLRFATFALCSVPRDGSRLLLYALSPGTPAPGPCSWVPGTVPLLYALSPGTLLMLCPPGPSRLIKSGQVTDQAELARLGNVSRARITQILDLLHLSPLIQDNILLAFSDKDCSRIREKNLRTIAREFCWIRQLSAWNALSTEQAAQPSNL